MTISFKDIDWTRLNTDVIDRALNEALANVHIYEAADRPRLLQWFIQDYLLSAWMDEFAAEFAQWLVEEEWGRYRTGVSK